MSLSNKIRAKAAIMPGFTQKIFTSIIKKCNSYEEALRVERTAGNQTTVKTEEDIDEPAVVSSRGRHIRTLEFPDFVNSSDIPAPQVQIKRPPKISKAVMPKVVNVDKSVKQPSQSERPPRKRRHRRGGKADNKDSVSKDVVVASTSNSSSHNQDKKIKGVLQIPFSPLKRDKSGAPQFIGSTIENLPPYNERNSEPHSRSPPQRSSTRSTSGSRPKSLSKSRSSGSRSRSRSKTRRSRSRSRSRSKTRRSRPRSWSRSKTRRSRSRSRSRSKTRRSRSRSRSRSKTRRFRSRSRSRSRSKTRRSRSRSRSKSKTRRSRPRSRSRSKTRRSRSRSRSRSKTQHSRPSSRSKSKSRRFRSRSRSRSETRRSRSSSRSKSSAKSRSRSRSTSISKHQPRSRSKSTTKSRSRSRSRSRSKSKSPMLGSPQQSSSPVRSSVRGPTPDRAVSEPGKTPFDVLKVVVKDVKFIKTTQANHGVLLEEVLQMLKNKGKILYHPKDMPSIPVDDEETFKELDKSVKKSSHAEYLVTKLSREGGKTVEECVERIMKKLMTRRVGKLFSMKSQKRSGVQKLQFIEYRLYTCVKDAVNIVHPNANGALVDNRISYFLKMSPFRKN